MRRRLGLGHAEPAKRFRRRLLRRLTRACWIVRFEVAAQRGLVRIVDHALGPRQNRAVGQPGRDRSAQSRRARRPGPPRCVTRGAGIRDGSESWARSRRPRRAAPRRRVRQRQRDVPPLADAAGGQALGDLLWRRQSGRSVEQEAVGPEIRASSLGLILLPCLVVEPRLAGLPCRLPGMEGRIGLARRSSAAAATPAAPGPARPARSGRSRMAASAAACPRHPVRPAARPAEKPARRPFLGLRGLPSHSAPPEFLGAGREFGQQIVADHALGARDIRHFGGSRRRARRPHPRRSAQAGRRWCR